MDSKFLLTASAFMLQHRIKLDLQKCKTKIDHLDELTISEKNDRKRLMFIKEELRNNERIGNLIKKLQNKKQTNLSDKIRLNMIEKYHTGHLLLVTNFQLSGF